MAALATVWLLTGCEATGTLHARDAGARGHDATGRTDGSAAAQDAGTNMQPGAQADAGSGHPGPQADAGSSAQPMLDGGGGTTPTSLFAEDFESTPDDTVPAGFHDFISYVVDGENSKSGGTYALVDSSRAHRGQRALHVRAGSQPAMITRALPVGTRALFVRVWVFLSGSLGHAEGRNHETLIGVRKTAGRADDEVRFGEIKGVIGVNEVPSDNISPRMDQWGKGPEISAGAWHCIEVAFRGDLPAHEVRAFSDGQEIFAVNDPSQWQNGPLSASFLDGKFGELILGWHSFSNYSNELWFDDLVAASERVGCD